MLLERPRLEKGSGEDRRGGFEATLAGWEAGILSGQRQEAEPWHASIV